MIEMRRNPTIADLYPHFSREQCEESETNIRRYVTVILGIAERLREQRGSITDDPVDCQFDDDARRM